MEEITCTSCSSDQTERMVTDYDDYMAYKCHECGDMFQVVPDTYQFVTAPLDESRILFEEDFIYV